MFQLILQHARQFFKETFLQIIAILCLLIVIATLSAIDCARAQESFGANSRTSTPRHGSKLNTTFALPNLTKSTVDKDTKDTTESVGSGQLSQLRLRAAALVALQPDPNLLQELDNIKAQTSLPNNTTTFTADKSTLLRQLCEDLLINSGYNPDSYNKIAGVDSSPAGIEYRNIRELDRLSGQKYQAVDFWTPVIPLALIYAPNQPDGLNAVYNLVSNLTLNSDDVDNALAFYLLLSFRLWHADSKAAIILATSQSAANYAVSDAVVRQLRAVRSLEDRHFSTLNRQTVSKLQTLVYLWYNSRDSVQAKEKIAALNWNCETAPLQIALDVLSAAEWGVDALTESQIAEINNLETATLLDSLTRLAASQLLLPVNDIRKHKNSSPDSRKIVGTPDSQLTPEQLALLLRNYQIQAQSGLNSRTGVLGMNPALLNGGDALNSLGSLGALSSFNSLGSLPLNDLGALLSSGIAPATKQDTATVNNSSDRTKSAPAASGYTRRLPAHSAGTARTRTVSHFR